MTDELAASASELLEKIASEPRFAGSASETRARKICATLLESHGFSTTENEFNFSEFPGRYGLPLVAAVWLINGLLTSYFYMRHGGARPAALVFLAMALIAGVKAWWLMRRGTTSFPWMRSRGTNLIAMRGEPSVWLVAHVDSKSQTIPMLARVASIFAATIAFPLLAISLVSGWIEVPFPVDASFSAAAPILGVIAAVTTLPLVFCFVGNTSPGAVDNASGLVSVLLALRMLDNVKNLGVIVTSAEELGLAGARAHARSVVPAGTALNCDTIDDVGNFRCIGPSRSPAGVAVSRVGAELGVIVTMRRMIPGVLADSLAFTDAGWDSVTVSRGNIATLARVHTRNDTRDRLDGTGIALAARLLAATVEELI